MIAPLERIQLYLSNSAREQSARITVPVDEWGHFKRSATVTIHQMSALIEPECIPFLNALMTSREVRALEESLTQGSGPKGLSALTVDERATLKNDLKTLIAQLKSSEWRIR